jgi:hypothetical protein
VCECARQARRVDSITVPDLQLSQLFSHFMIPKN